MTDQTLFTDRGLGQQEGGRDPSPNKATRRGSRDASFQHNHLA